VSSRFPFVELDPYRFMLGLGDYFRSRGLEREAATTEDRAYAMRDRELLLENERARAWCALEDNGISVDVRND
jgi:hypothetical protein